ncbi:MAG: glycosyltransferase family 1 protein [Hydrogenophilus sp.]|nr:glycosyltransferase family 1 protein [Hydrogenophilus sp.]
MKIAFITDTYLPDLNGVAHSLAELIQALHALGIETRIWSPTGEASNLHRVPSIPLPRYPELKLALPVAAHLAKVWRSWQPHWVHIATEGLLGLAALWVARRLGIPVVSSYHTHFLRYLPHYGLSWLRRPARSYLRRFHAATALTLCPTASLAAQLTAAGYGFTAVLGRGLTPGVFSPNHRSAALRTAWGADAHTVVWLTVGRLAPDKNLLWIVRAWKALPAHERQRARLVWVGDGPLRRTLQEALPEAIFTGRLDGQALAAAYASGDLFLFPSGTDTFGNVVVEALASGLPVVAQHEAAALEWVAPDPQRGETTPIGDEESWQRAVHRWHTRIAATPWPRLTPPLFPTWAEIATSYCHAVARAIGLPLPNGGALFPAVS